MKIFKLILFSGLILFFGTFYASAQQKTSEIEVKYNHGKGTVETKVITKKVEEPVKNTNQTSTATGIGKSAEAMMNDVFSGRVARAAFDQQQAAMRKASLEKEELVTKISTKYPKELLALYQVLRAKGIANLQENHEIIQNYAVKNGINSTDAAIMFERNLLAVGRFPFAVLYKIEDQINKEELKKRTYEQGVAEYKYQNIALQHKVDLMKIHRHFNSAAKLQAKDKNALAVYARSIGMSSTTIDDLLYTAQLKNGTYDFGQEFNAYLESNYIADAKKKLVGLEGKLAELNRKMVALKIGKNDFKNERIDSLCKALGIKLPIDSVIALLGEGTLKYQLRMLITEQNNEQKPLAEVMRATAAEMYKRGIVNTAANAIPISNVMSDLGYYYKDYIDLFSCNASNGELQSPPDRTISTISNTNQYSIYDCAKMIYTKLSPYYNEVKKADEAKFLELEKTSKRELKKFVELLLERRIINNVGNTKQLITVCQQNKFDTIKAYLIGSISDWTNIEIDKEASETPYNFPLPRRL